VQLLRSVVLPKIPEEISDEVEKDESERDRKVDSEIPERMILCDGKRRGREGVVGRRRHGVDVEDMLDGDMTLTGVGEDGVLEGRDVRAREGGESSQSFLDRSSP